MEKYKVNMGEELLSPFIVIVLTSIIIIFVMQFLYRANPIITAAFSGLFYMLAWIFAILIKIWLILDRAEHLEE